MENPASDVALPPVENRRSQKVSPDQVKEILDALQETRWYLITFIGFHTGLRVGEILGLLWKYIDLDAGTLEVARGLVAVKGKGLVLGTSENGCESSHHSFERSDCESSEGTPEVPERSIRLTGEKVDDGERRIRQ